MLIPNSISYQSIDLPLLAQHGVKLTVKRLDLVHGQVSGNKFYKLQYNLQEAIQTGYAKVLTFGGAYSNHIHACAVACNLVGLKSIGIIRGEETLPLNPTLMFAQEQGMQLHYWDRTSYREKNKPERLQELKETFGKIFIIPEGGTNALAIKGTSEILHEKDGLYSHIITAIGTGGTFAGLANSIQEHQQLLGVSTLKGNFISQEINSLLDSHGIKSKGKLHLLMDYHFGGYAKWTEDLISLIKEFNTHYRLPLDPIYTGKMMAAILGEIDKGKIPKGSHILAIHTGGLQGVKGFESRTGMTLS